MIFFIIFVLRDFTIYYDGHHGAIPSLFSVQIDITGQISTDSVGARIISGTGGQLDFVKGAKMSEGGKSITAFPSRTKKGQSKIVPILDEGAGVVTPRADAQWIVTEYGAVNIEGRSLQERAKMIISIAHPDDRDMLMKAAYERYNGLRV